jgi:hypothetical protein
MRLSNFSWSSIAATRAAALSGGEASLSQILFEAKGPDTQSGPIALAEDSNDSANRAGVKDDRILMLCSKPKCSTNTLVSPVPTSLCHSYRLQRHE